MSICTTINWFWSANSGRKQATQQCCAANDTFLIKTSSLPRPLVGCASLCKGDNGNYMLLVEESRRCFVNIGLITGIVESFEKCAC